MDGRKPVWIVRVRRDMERRTVPRSGLTSMLRDVLFTTLRWIGRHVRGFYAAVGAFMLIGLVLALLGTAAFALLAEQVMEGATQRLDNSILLWMNEHANPRLDIVAMEVTSLGSGVVTWMIVLVSSVFLWTSRHRYSVLLLWVAVMGGWALNSTLKAIFERPRPELFPWRVPHAGQSSFPSGHSMGAMVMYATLAYLVARLESTPAMRRLTFVFAAILVALIGASRMYLGVHYPSDVLGGFAIGLAWATFCALGIEAVRHFRGRKPGVERAEQDLEAGAPLRS